MIVSGENVIMMAVQIEDIGIQFYGELKNIFKEQSPEYKIMDFLQKEEMKHKVIYERLQHKIRTEKRRILAFSEEDIKNIRIIIEAKIFDEISKAKEYASSNKRDIPRLLLYAISFELDTLYFFETIEDKILPSEKQIIQDIIKEEQKHVDKLLDLRKKIKFG